MAAPHRFAREARHQPWLDVVRAVAALLVLLSHVRQFTLRDAAEQPVLSLPARVLFALSGLGHQAVIVFFVLSGFLVAKAMNRLTATGEWSLLRFGLDRVSRLWPVLIPCLLLGGVLDAIGLHMADTDPARYGRLALTAPLAAPAYDGATLLGNVFFLQTIAVPVFGANGPLWSLADEFWFYALGALGVAAWRARALLAAALPLLALVLCAAWLPRDVLALFPVWLAGAAAFLAGPAATSPTRTRLRLGTAAAGMVAALVTSRLRIGLGPLAADWLLAFATAALLRWVALLDMPRQAALRPLLAVSALSYSLYLSHVPILALASTLLVGPHRLGLGATSTAIMLLDLAVTLAGAVAIWWAFERHTPTLRRLLVRHVAVRPRTLALPSPLP